MRRLLPALAASLFTLAASGHAAGLHYQCDDGISRIQQAGAGKSVWLESSNQRQQFHPTRAASGVRYVSGKQVWWSKGEQATLWRGRHVVAQCQLQTSAAPASQAVDVDVSWLQRRLFPGARLKVQLLDVSRADAPAQVISEHSMTLVQGSPLRVQLAVPAGAIDARHRYAVAARLEQDGQLLMITTRHYGVLTYDADAAARIVLDPVR